MESFCPNFKQVFQIVNKMSIKCYSERHKHSPKRCFSKHVSVKIPQNSEPLFNQVSFLNKVSFLKEVCHFIKSETPAQVLFCEFSRNFEDFYLQNNFGVKNKFNCILKAASVYLQHHFSWSENTKYLRRIHYLFITNKLSLQLEALYNCDKSILNKSICSVSLELFDWLWHC